MKNKNLLIALGVGVVVYYFYNKKQKEKLKATPYTDAELDKVVTNFINKQLTLAKVYEPNKNAPDAEKGKKEVLEMIKQASLNGKDVSRANIDRILGIYDKFIRNMYGDKSIGIATPEEMNLFYDFRNVNVPIQNSQGFFPQTPVGQSQIAPINVGSEERNMGGGLYIKYGKCDSVTYKCQIVSVRQLAQGEGGGYVRTFTEKGMYFKEKGNVNVAPIVTQITEKEWNDLIQSVLMRTGF